MIKNTSIPASRLRKKKESKQPKRAEAKVGKLIRVTPGKRHGWYESDAGIIRKPLQ